MIDSSDVCTYCGALATDRDHVVPVAYQGVRYFTSSNWVWACSECNSFLVDQMLVTVQDRAAFLAERLAKRYRRVINMPHWTQEELSELGDRMRMEVQRGLKMKRLVAQRIENCRIVSRHGVPA